MSIRPGKRAARRADGSVGKGWWKKRRPSCNEADRGCTTHTVTSPHAKAGADVPSDDFHRVSRHEKADGDTETGVRRIGSSQVATGASLRKPPETAARVLSSA